MNKNVFRVLAVFLLLSVPRTAFAQEYSLSTNLVDWANLGTVNLDAGISVSRHITLHAGGRYNPWEFHQNDPCMLIREQQKTVYAGARWWGWYVDAGWWLGGKLQYSAFDQTGLWRPAREKGQAVGVGLSAGYTLMLAEHLNLEFGLGAWVGSRFDYTLYYSPALDDVRESGARPFIAPDNVLLSLMYVF